MLMKAKKNNVYKKFLCELVNPEPSPTIDNGKPAYVLQHIDIRWQIQEFQNRRARSQRGRILWVCGLFWCSLTHTLCFCSELRAWNTYFKHCILWFQKLSVNSQNYQTPQTNSSRGSAPGGPVLDQPLTSSNNYCMSYCFGFRFPSFFKKKIFDFDFGYRYLPLCGLLWWMWEWTYSFRCPQRTHTNHKAS